LILHAIDHYTIAHDYYIIIWDHYYIMLLLQRHYIDISIFSPLLVLQACTHYSHIGIGYSLLAMPLHRILTLISPAIDSQSHISHWYYYHTQIIYTEYWIARGPLMPLAAHIASHGSPSLHTAQVFWQVFIEAQEARSLLSLLFLLPLRQKIPPLCWLSPADSAWFSGITEPPIFLPDPSYWSLSH